VDGTPDTGFDPGAGSSVRCLAIQGDGKIIFASGGTGILGRQLPSYLGRLNPDGTLDDTFNPPTNSVLRDIYCLALQPDGKIVLAGQEPIFVAVFGVQLPSREYLGRLNPDGTPDDGFNAGAFGGPWDGAIASLILQADGKILVAGTFSTLGGQDRGNIGRLNADGTVDLSFNPGADGAVSALALQADGNLLVGGSFGTLCGQSCTNLGRLINTGPATQSLSFDGTTLTWRRGSTSPEVSRVTFESTSDGNSWTLLGSGQRFADGWQLTGLTLLPNTDFRARGYTAGAFGDGSGWLLETVWNPVPRISDLSCSPAGQLGFNVLGRQGQQIVIESSSDLKLWRPLGTNTLPTESLFFTDPQPTLSAQQFYRVRSTP
jgi:uncharacterized delta-60 repeat protein